MIPEADLAPTQRKVLVIEDNVANTQLMVSLFARRPDIQLITAALGRSGLELAAKHLPDVILLDLRLPDISGHDVLLALRDDPILKRVPVVIVSAEASASQSESLIKAGAFRYVTKPFDVHELLTIVDAAFEERSRPS